MYRFVFFEINFLYETLYPCIDRGDLLPYLCVVRVLHIAGMDKSGAEVCCPGYQQGYDNSIVDQFSCLSCSHYDIRFYKVWVIYFIL